MSKEEFQSLIQEVTGAIAGKPVDGPSDEFSCVKVVSDILISGIWYS